MKNHTRFLFLVAILTVFAVGCSKTREIPYSVPPALWPESFGNHRAVVKVPAETAVATLDLEWRRHDRNPENRQLIMVNAATGDTLKNIYRYRVDNERCVIAFGPVSLAGEYHLYYLPYLVQEGWGFYGKGYLKPEPAPDPVWLSENNVEDTTASSKFIVAEVLEIQSRTAFDSFYPMEIIALKSEKDSLLKEHSGDFMVFPGDRSFPIRMLDEIPQKWIIEGPSGTFSGEAQRNEYYAFQMGVWAVRKPLENVKVEFSPLKMGKSQMDASQLTCFNTGGIGPYGDPFEKRVDIAEGGVQTLWIGVDIPEDAAPGQYSGTATIRADNSEPQTIQIRLRVENPVLADRGDSEPWRHSRLRWLNSTLGIDDQPTKGYQPLKALGDNTYGFTGKTMRLSEKGFPGSLKVKEAEILNRPLSFVVETENGIQAFSDPQNVRLVKNQPGIMQGAWESISDQVKIEGLGTIESDGYLNYKLKVKALDVLNIKDIRLEIPIRKEVAAYMMGMGLPGTRTPLQHTAKWDGPHDSFWIGDTRAGIWCEFRGGIYHGPLLNLYHPEYPVSWYNENKGGFKIESTRDEVLAVVYSGSRQLKQGEELEFEWSMLITPVKEINYPSQFTDRYFHDAMNPIPTEEDILSGVKIVNLHHASNYNPHINYPFVAVDSMKWFVNHLHQKGQKVKIYYTIRELTNYTTELWALRSLGNEILGEGQGGGYPWLREHLITGYRPQWYQWFPDKSADASIVNAPGDSRWYNYYIEGLAWLVKNVDIDGLYLDDVSYDRRTVKRIRKVLDNNKSGCLLDLHSNTGFSKGPATQYAEFFPYMDKLWFGESFQYDKMPPENWLVEVSGIPFGLMGDMLHGGGNPWLGMLFGMTVRFPWFTEGVTCDPRSIWKIWDDFGIRQSRMEGFWEDSPAITTSDAEVKVTTYRKEGSTLIAIGNFSDELRTVSLKIDFAKLGLEKDKVMLYAPAIENFQEEKQWRREDEIPVVGRRGWVICFR
jgi:hypothetical protein